MRIVAEEVRRARPEWRRTALGTLLVFASAWAFAQTLLIVRDGPAFALAGGRDALVMELAAAAAVMLAGIVALLRRRPFAIAMLAIAPLWLAREWASPATPEGVVFTLGLVLTAAWIPATGVVALAYPDGMHRQDRWLVLVGFAATATPALVRAATFDPVANGCGECPPDLLLVHDVPGASTFTTGFLAVWGAASCLLLLGGLAHRVARSTAARRSLTLPVVVSAGFIITTAVAGSILVVAGQPPYVVARDLTPVQSIGLVALAAASSWELVRLGGVRRRAARLVTDMSAAPAPGRLRDELARITHDPSIELAFPLADRVVDRSGRTIGDPRAATVLPPDRRVTATLTADGRELALLTHRAGLFDDDGFRDAVVRSCALVLEHERMQAELASRVTDLREARMRLVARFDSERRRLERDLHDGAQQRMVALLLELRLARGQHPDPSLDTAIVEVEAALDELRDIAHGLFPPALAEEGLAGALVELREGSEAAVVLKGLPDGRWPAGIEAAAYIVVAETLRSPSLERAEVDVTVADDVLTVAVTGIFGVDAARAGPDTAQLADRVGAVGGVWEVERHGNVLRMRAELPCGL